MLWMYCFSSVSYTHLDVYKRQLYLTTLLHPDEDYIEEVTGQVEEIYRRGRSSWRAAWLLLYLSREYSRSASGKWIFLEKQFQYGCTSPVLYIEALLMLNHNPAVLRKLDKFCLLYTSNEPVAFPSREYGADHERAAQDLQF